MIKEWVVYIVSCSDGSLYTGISKNVKKRIKEHNTSNRGAKYTKSRRPVKLVYLSHPMNKSNALKEEHKIKKLSRKQKLKLLKNESNCL